MQNSPLLVTKTSPVNSVNSSINQEQSKQPKDSFESVLSKHVKHNETQAPATKNDHANKERVNATGDDNVSKADVALGKPVDASEELLQTLADSAMVKGNVSEAEVDAETLASVDTVTHDDALDTAVDAESLAREAITKTLQDVTDGKVAIATPQDTSALQVPLAHMKPVVQTASQQAATDTTADVDALDPLKQAVPEVGKDAVADEKADVVGDRLQANALKDTNEKLNPKFANVLATEGKQQTSVQDLAETNLKAAPDVAAMSLQAAAAKPAATLASAPLQAGASNMINASPGKAGWNEAVSQKVVWMVGATEQSATLTLNPKDLGPLQVIINVNNEKADATFISENPEVRKALEEGMSSLRQSMGQVGVELGQANVNTSKQHQEFQQANKEYVARQTNEANTSQDPENIGNVPVNIHVSNGLVDTFV